MKRVFKDIKKGRIIAVCALSLLFIVGAVSGTWNYAEKPPAADGTEIEVGFDWENYYKYTFSDGDTYCYIHGYNSDNFDTLFDGETAISDNTAFRWTNWNSSSNDEFKQVTMELHKTDENAGFTFDEIRLHHFVDSGGASRLPKGIEISYLDENDNWTVFVSCTLEGDGEWGRLGLIYTSTDNNPPHYEGTADNKAAIEQSWRYPGDLNGIYRMQLRSESSHGAWNNNYRTVNYNTESGTAPFTVFKSQSGVISAKSVRITLIPADSSNKYNCAGLTELEFFVDGTKYPYGSAP